MTEVQTIASNGEIARLVAAVNEAAADYDAYCAKRGEIEARRKVAELDGDAETLAKFKSASDELVDWHRFYCARKDAAEALLKALTVDPALIKAIL